MNLTKKMKTKENVLIITTVLGVVLLSFGILLIKIFPSFATNLIIVGSFLFYISIIALVFLTK